MHYFVFNSIFFTMYSLIPWNYIQNAAENEKSCAKTKWRQRLQVWVNPQGFAEQ